MEVEIEFNMVDALLDNEWKSYLESVGVFQLDIISCIDENFGEAATLVEIAI